MNTYYFIAYEQLYKAVFKTGLMKRWHKEQNAAVSMYIFEIAKWERIYLTSAASMKSKIAKNYLQLTDDEAVAIILIGKSELERRRKRWKS